MILRLKNIFLLAVSAVLLAGAALFNGFPLVYSDTGTYIISGFKLETPLDRPITYGILLRILSLNGISLWTVIFFQCMLLAFLLFECFRNFTSTRKPGEWTVISCAVLSAFTGVSFVASQLIADIFAPVTIICLALLLFSGSLSRAKRIFLFTMLLFAAAAHISHFFIAFFLVTGVFIFAWWQKKRKHDFSWRKKNAVIALLLILVSFSADSVSIGKSGHVFLMGRMAESGILKKFLDENCPHEHFKLCDCKDSLPQTADGYIWSTEGHALLTAGGWKQSKAESDEIIRRTLTSPKYLLLHLRAAASAFTLQLYTIGSGEGLVRYDTSFPAGKNIATYFPGEDKAYIAAQQYSGKMDKPELFNLLSAIFTGIAVLAVFSWRFFQKERTRMRIVFTFFLAAYLLNCLVCAGLVTVANRFGCRMVWLFPFFLLLLAANGEFTSFFNRKNRSS